MNTTDLSILRNRRVLIFQQRNWALNIGHELAKKLSSLGCRLAALTIKEEAHTFVTTQNEVNYDLIVSGDAIKYDPASFLGDDDYSLDHICSELGIKTVWEIVQSMRLHVKSYPDKYFYGFKQNIDDQGIIQYVKATYKNIRRVFDTFDPEVIAGPNFVALQHIMFNLYAQKHGVEMIGISDSKVSDALYFSHSYMEDRGPFFDRFHELEAGATSQNEERAREYIARSMTELVQPEFAFRDITPHKGLVRRIKDEIIPYYQCLLYYRQGKHRIKDIFGATLDNRPPKFILRDHYVRKKYVRHGLRFPYTDIRSLGRYAFTPLQSQPETTMDTQAPRFNNQLETVRQIAMSLPGDMTLVVKDHPNMLDRRPSSYLEKIARTPNVKLVSPKLKADEVLSRAEVVVAPGGTIIAEATMMRKPAVQLGGLFKTRLLPNVVSHTDCSTLPDALERALAIDVHSPEYDRKLLHYVAAMYDVGFGTEYLAIWDKGKQKGLEEFIERFAMEIALSLPEGNGA